MRYIAGVTSSGLVWAVRLLARLIPALTIVSLLTGTSLAMADEGSAVAQQSPYMPPQTEIDLFPWAGSFANLPLWAQAALVSAVGVGAFFFVPPVARRIWGMFAGPDGDGS